MYFAVRYFKPYAPIWAFLPVLFEATLEFVYQPAGVTIAIDTSYINGHRVQHWVYDPKYFWMSVVYFLAIAWLVIYLTYLIFSSRRVTMDQNTIRLQNIFLYGIFFMFIVAPLVFTAYLLINSDIIRFYWISIVGRSVLVIGMTLFTYSFYQSTKENDFFQPQPLESLYILDAQTSELLYKKDFRVNVEARAQENIAANITILNKLLGDALGFRSLMTEINFLDKEFLITNVVETNIIIILVVEFSTNIIEERYTELTSLVGQIGNYDDLTINPLVHGLFGY